MNNFSLLRHQARRLSLRCLLTAALPFLLLTTTVTTTAHAATVNQPNGTLLESREDLRVKVLGGWVVINRSWTVDNVATGGGKWHFNPAWAELKFTFDSLDGSVKSIRRIDAAYDKGGNGIYIFGKLDFIKAVTAPDPANPTKTIITGWRWYNTTGDWITYNKDGRITAYGDRNNIQVSFEIDANGQPSAIKDHSGNLVLSFTYAANKISRVTDRTNRQVQYTWVNNALTEVTDVLGNKTLYQYAAASVNGAPTSDASGQLPDKNLTGITDQEGRLSQFTYTGNRVAKMIDPMNNATTYTSNYDKGKRQWNVITDYPGGRRMEVTYNALGEAVKTDMGTRTIRQMVKTSPTSDIKIDERGNATRFDYDSRFNPIKITYPDGSSSSATYDAVYSNALTSTDEAGVLTTFEYDSKGNRLKMIAAKGTADEQTTTSTYDSFGQMLTLTRVGRAASGSNPAVSDATTTFTYDTLGNLTSITDGENNKIELSNFDAIGNAQSIKDARGNISTVTYNAKGWRLTQANPLGHTLRTTYDKVGNPTSTTDPSGAITQFAYNKRNELTDITDALGGILHYDYDTEGRAIKATDPGHDSPSGPTRIITQYAFDADGRIIKNTDGNGNVVTGTWGGNGDGLDGLLKSVQYPTYREDYRFDNRNRKTQTIRVLDATTQYASSSEFDARGNVIASTDPLNRKAKTDYDSLSRPKIGRASCRERVCLAV